MDRNSHFLQVEGAPALFRDTTTSAIINTDVSGYQAYLHARDTIKQRNIEMQRQASEIQSMKEELGTIKSLLMQLVSKE